MPGVANGNGPGYISAHSADVILSDIRPVKLNPEALGAINVLLDEFLHTILTASRSLSTEKLRSSLLSVLPTSLGKEALLEAEVELRAYWERTTSRAPPEDDSRTFHLQWSFELLRLKCSGYSTLNEDDEDPTEEVRVNEIFSKAHPHPPQVGLLDPAALYLTAILESLCEHILSNVGRVAARDSSRTYATTNDLFVALCEDDSIYGFFRSMKVYHQIETMAEALTPKSRRSKSSQQDRSLSRTSSPHGLSSVTLTPSARSRQSSEGQPTSSPPRSSGEKLRKRDSAKGHNQTSSIRSEVFRQVDESYDPTQGAAMQREFDDLMRSASTMKMSLTPDRLKTMEAFKQEKDQKNFGRRPDAPFPVKSPGTPLVQRPSFGHLKHKSQDTKTRSRRGSVSSTTFQGIVPARLRSLSTSGSSWGKLTRTPSIKTASKASFSSSTSTPPSTEMPRTTADNNGFPKRMRAKARHRESMDLDDILNRSDEDLDDVGSMTRSPLKSPPKPAHAPQRISPGTRDLIEFLAEGPPEAPTLSRAGRELVDFLAEGPPNYVSSIVSLDKSGGSGTRLQKMMSKLNLGYNEKAKGGSDIPRTQHNSRVESKSSNNTLSSLANKPIPPRPPRAPNAPSAFPACDMPDENKDIRQRTKYPSYDPSSSVERLVPEPSKSIVPPIPHPLSSSQMAEKAFISVRSAAVIQTNGITNGNVPHATQPPRSPSQHMRSPFKTTIPPATVVVQAVPTIAEPDIHDMHRLLTNATTADECRLIFGMFMARNGISLEPKQGFSGQVPLIGSQTGLEAGLESSLVEILL